MFAQIRKFSQVLLQFQCLAEGYLRKSMELLNCTAPWVTENKQLWCDSKNISDKKKKDVENFLTAVIYGSHKPKNCLRPCKSVK